MKKIIAIFISVVLCITCFAMPVYADDLDTPSGPVDIDEYVVREIHRTGTFDVFNGADNYGVTITIQVSGDVSLDNNGSIVSFSLDSFTHYETISGGELLLNNVSYGNYYTSGNYLFLRIDYFIIYKDSNGTLHPENSHQYVLFVV